MKSKTVDVAVVGGGPSGSNSARIVKELDNELDVVLYERGESPSSQCAGGLGIPFKKHMGFTPPEEVVKSPIRDVVIESPNERMTLNGQEVDTGPVEWMDDEDELGWVVDRHKFDQHQLDKAEAQGVEVNTRHTVKSVSQNGDPSITVLDRQNNEQIEVSAKYIILANGVNWQLAKDAGFDANVVEPPKSQMHMGLQYEFKDPDYFNEYGEDTIYLLFDRDYAPNGYTWSFASGDEYTKWGAGVPMSSDASVKEGLHDFLEDNNKMEMMEETTRRHTNGIIPTARPLDSAVSGKVALVGDVAHHTDALHGGGMLMGVRAAKAVGQAIHEDNLDNYDSYWKDDFLDTLQHRFILRDLIHGMDNDEYDRFVKSINDFQVNGVNPDVEIPRMLWHCLKNDAGIFGKSAKEATKSMAKQKLGNIM